MACLCLFIVWLVASVFIVWLLVDRQLIMSLSIGYCLLTRGVRRAYLYAQIGSKHCTPSPKMKRILGLLLGCSHIFTYPCLLVGPHFDTSYDGGGPLRTPGRSHSTDVRLSAESFGATKFWTGSC